MAYSSDLHGIHNEKVCRELMLTPEYKDWVITTSFYSALHFLRHAIFPLTFNSKRGYKVTASTFNQYCMLEGHEGQKHTVFKKLVESECIQDIAISYKRLLDTSYTARYNDYQFSEEISKKAIGQLNAIKNYCKGKKSFSIKAVEYESAELVKSNGKLA